MRCRGSRRVAVSPVALQAGVGLIEVLVSVLILAIGLLGIAAMQATALRNSQGSFERTQVVIQSYSILDAMRANRNAAIAGEYALGGGMICAVPASGTLAQADMQRWISSLKDSIGSGVATDTTTCGQVVCTAAGQCTVTVRWDDSRATDGAGGARAAGDATRDEQTVATL
jgi:type IV pilus assembly protein PilV